MKRCLYLVGGAMLCLSLVRADDYDVWTQEMDFAYSICLPLVVDYKYCNIELRPEDKDAEYPYGGSIVFYMKKTKILDNVEIEQDIEEVISRNTKEEKGRITDNIGGPFMGPGKSYILYNRTTDKYYSCFIEWCTAIFETFPEKRRMPRLSIAPLAKLGKEYFIYNGGDTNIYNSKSFGEELTRVMKKVLGEPITPEEYLKEREEEKKKWEKEREVADKKQQELEKKAKQKRSKK